MFTFVVHNYFNIELQKELIGQIMNLCLKSGIFFILKTVGGVIQKNEELYFFMFYQ